jgi:hypothetical protein
MKEGGKEGKYRRMHQHALREQNNNIQELAKVMFRVSLAAYYTPKSIIESNTVAWALFW